MITTSADGSLYLKGMTWTGWGTATARGRGTLEVDNCNPNCAQGTDTPYPATVILSGLKPYGNGEQAYSVMTVTVPSSPSHSQRYSIRLVP